MTEENKSIHRERNLRNEVLLFHMNSFLHSSIQQVLQLVKVLIWLIISPLLLIGSLIGYTISLANHFDVFPLTLLLDRPVQSYPPENIYLHAYKRINNWFSILLFLYIIQFLKFPWLVPTRNWCIKHIRRIHLGDLYEWYSS